MAGASEERASKRRRGSSAAPPTEEDEAGAQAVMKDSIDQIVVVDGGAGERGDAKGNDGDAAPDAATPAVDTVRMSEWVVDAVVLPSSLDEGPKLKRVEELSSSLHPALKAMGVRRLFPVQAAAVRTLLTEGSMLCHPGDVCVAAPTGSGKTLTYVLPIVQVLSTRTVVRLRALVILPTRELVTQVVSVLSAVAAGTGLIIKSATGQQSFAQEQRALVGETSREQAGGEIAQGGASLVDILVCTPGRLVDHLASTPGFTLQHLRYLVIDEADRLLGQSYQHWLPRVIAAAEGSDTVPAQDNPCALFQRGISDTNVDYE